MFPGRETATCTRGKGRNETYLVGTGDDTGEGTLLLPLAQDHGLDDAGVVGAQVDETMRHASSP